MDIFRGDVAEVDVVDAGAVSNIEGHAGAGDDEFILSFLLNFVEAGATGDALSLQCRGNGKTDGFVGAGFVGDDELGF